MEAFIDPSLRQSHDDRVTILPRSHRRDECFAIWHEKVSHSPQSLNAIGEMVTSSLIDDDLERASDYAWIYAALRWGSQWYPRGPAGAPLQPLPRPAATLTASKLRHDIEQMVYLQGRGIIGGEFTQVLNEYERVAKRLSLMGAQAREALAGDDARHIGHVYNRIIHIRETPRVAKALSHAWDVTAIEERYLGQTPSVVVVDDFLSVEALESLRLFCLESTVWSTNRYGYGRLGSFFRDGFNCPLLIQIAEELRRSLPRILGRYPLRQLWGFKYGSRQPGNTTHADFAAVNVNFWITPSEANLDSSSGGLLVFDVKAPLDWDFAKYNRDGSAINRFLQRRNAGTVCVPYRHNRAVIFDSNLFHATDALEFRTGYENRRLNVTMLYGDRENAARN